MNRTPTARRRGLSRRWTLAWAAAAFLVVAPACRHAPDGAGDGTADAGPDGGAPDAGPAFPVVSPNDQGWWRDDVFYEIFVRSFQDSDGDGVGDFRGLTERLDYLNDGDPSTTTDLGIDALWLMPIYPSPSYHGYDVTDYQEVNPAYGTLDDFDAFLREAKARGIRVILDFVLNHSSSQHPWFQSARQGPDAPYRDYYVWEDERPEGWRRPWDGQDVLWHQANDDWYYGIFWSGMPDLNLQNPEVKAAMLDAMRFWLDRGVDGFRIDAARYLVEEGPNATADTDASHRLIQELRWELHQDHPEALLVAEAWTALDTVAEYAGQGNEFQLAFAFDLAGAIIESVDDGNKATLNQTLYLYEQDYEDMAFNAPFLTNHDHVRVMRQLEGDWAKARLAAALLLAMPGTPFLYYGEEIGMQGNLTSPDQDPGKRTPMRWTADAPAHGFTEAGQSWFAAQWGTAAEAEAVDVESQMADADSLWHLYRRLIALRGDHPALAVGEVSRPYIDAPARGAYALLRTTPEQKVVLVVNLHTEPTGPFTVPVEGAPTVLEAEGLPAPPTSGSDGLAFEGLDPQSFAFIELE